MIVRGQTPGTTTAEALAGSVYRITGMKARMVPENHWQLDHLQPGEHRLVVEAPYAQFVCGYTVQRGGIGERYSLDLHFVGTATVSDTRLDELRDSLERLWTPTRMAVDKLAARSTPATLGDRFSILRSEDDVFDMLLAATRLPRTPGAIDVFVVEDYFLSALGFVTNEILGDSMNPRALPAAT